MSTYGIKYQCCLGQDFNIGYRNMFRFNEIILSFSKVVLIPSSNHRSQSYSQSVISQCFVIVQSFLVQLWHVKGQFEKSSASSRLSVFCGHLEGRTSEGCHSSYFLHLSSKNSLVQFKSTVFLKQGILYNNLQSISLKLSLVLMYTQVHNKKYIYNPQCNSID